MRIELEVAPEAEELADRVREANPDRPLVFVVDDGCCENTGLQLQQLWWVDPGFLRLGEIAGLPVYCPANIARFLDGSVIRVKVVPGEEMVDSFSLETAFGCRFSTLVTLGAPREAGPSIS